MWSERSRRITAYSPKLAVLIDMGRSKIHDSLGDDVEGIQQGQKAGCLWGGSFAAVRAAALIYPSCPFNHVDGVSQRPAGARTVKRYLFPGFHPGLFSTRPYGTVCGVSGG